MIDQIMSSNNSMRYYYGARLSRQGRLYWRLGGRLVGSNESVDTETVVLRVGNTTTMTSG